MAHTIQEFEALMPDATQLLSDEPEMESSTHYAQLALLVACLEMLWGDRDDFFIGANLTIYFSREQLKNKEFRGPDLFLVKGTERRPRASWVVWEEGGRYPNVIIELLSSSTAGVDRGLKKVLYQDRFRTPEYFWFGPDTLEFQGFRLVDAFYVAIPEDDRGWRWSRELGMYLGVHQGQLRYFTEAGDLVPTPEEARRAERDLVVVERRRVQAAQERAQAAQERAQAAQERAQAEQERAEAADERAVVAEERAEAERLRAERLAVLLRERGIEVED
jgi:Uma2 family endonuclease